MYRDLKGEKRRLPGRIKAIVTLLKSKYELKERHLFLNGQQTSCKHLCLHNTIKDFFVPSKGEVETIFEMAYRPDKEWKSVKKKLMKMKIYSTASGLLYEELFDKCKKKELLVKSKKRKRLSDSDEEYYDIKCAAKINITNKMILRKYKRLEEEKTTITQASDKSYPIKQILSDLMDKSWIVPLLHMISTIPEIAINILNLPHDKLNNQFKTFIKEYWGNNIFLAEPEELCNYVRRLSRNEKDYKDLWQAWLYVASRCKLNQGKVKILYELFMGELKNGEDFLYLPLNLYKKDIDVKEYLVNQQFVKFPLLITVLFNRDDLSLTVKLPLNVPISQFNYKLCQIICCCMHEAEGPHFFSYILNPCSGIWFIASETEVKQITITDVDLSHAFFAIYRQGNPEQSVIKELINH